MDASVSFLLTCKGLPSCFLSTMHLEETPAYTWLPGLPQRCKELTCLTPVCMHQCQGTHLTHRGCQALQRACTKREIIPFCVLSLHSRGSESAFGFIWAQVSEHYQAVFPEGRWHSGDVRHYSRVLLHGGAELDEQCPGESGASALWHWWCCCCLAPVQL